MPKEAVSELRTLSLDLLDADPRNAKEHTDIQIDQLSASVESYGFNDPVGVIPTAGGRFLIVEGHGRSMAARKLGMTEVPCLILPSMTVSERKAYAIAHNQIQSITGLDMDIVADEFNRLGVGEEDHMSIGFTQEDVLFLLPDPMDNNPGAQGMTEGADSEEGYKTDSWKGYMAPVYKSTMHFNTEGDQLAFYKFVDVLRGRYLTAATIAERFVLFVQEFGGVKEEETIDADV